MSEDMIRPLFCMQRFFLKDIPTVNLSGLESANDVHQMICNCITVSPDLVFAVGSKEYSIQLNKGFSACISNGNTLLMLDDYDKNSKKGILKQYKIVNGTLVDQTINTDVQECYVFDKNFYYLYFKNIEDQKGEMYDDSKLIAKNVYTSSVYRFGEKLYYMTDYDFKTKKGTLNSGIKSVKKY